MLQTWLDEFPHDFSVRLERATEGEQRAVALSVAQFALRLTGLDDPVIEEALHMLVAGKYEHGPVTVALQKLAEDLDIRYFKAEELYKEGKAGEEESREFFAKARAANAVLLAFEHDALDASAKSIYEATAAIGPDEVLPVAMAALRSE